MAWKTVAEGPSIDQLTRTVGDTEYGKGVRMRIVMETSTPWLFDMAGAELVFGGVVPDGWDMVDVWGENGKGVVEIEADPAWLVATLAFMARHWLALTIAGFVIWAFVSFITIMVQVPAIAQIPFALLIGAGLGIVGLLLLQGKNKVRAP